MRLLRWLAVVALAGYVAWVAWADWIKPALNAEPETSGKPVVVQLHVAVDRLAVEPEDHTPYQRSYFGDGWIDADHDCRNTRREVLARESSVPVAGGCKVYAGRWRSWYDNTTWTRSYDVQIDHLVPLAEAWDSGAFRWSQGRRIAFANDLDDPRTLVPVSGEVNDDKDADDPTWWLPPENKCRYIADWIAVKIRWDLSADVRERDAIDAAVAKCPNQVVSVRRAR